MCVCVYGVRIGVRIQVLGDLEMLSEGVQRAASNAMRVSAHHNKAILNICFAYTGRHDIYQVTHTHTRCLFPPPDASPYRSVWGNGKDASPLRLGRLG